VTGEARLSRRVNFVDVVDWSTESPLPTAASSPRGEGGAKRRVRGGSREKRDGEGWLSRRADFVDEVDFVDFVDEVDFVDFVDEVDF